MKTADILIVGAGIVGLAAAVQILQRDPTIDLQIIEKERQPAEHQTGRNSGVIHSGIYYRPGSLKAELCVGGRALLETFCDEHNIPWERCGKVIVATDAAELPQLEKIRANGTRNGVSSIGLDAEELTDREPHVRGLSGLFVPSTGIVDYGLVARTMARLVEELGGRLAFGEEVVGIKSRSSHSVVSTSLGEYSAGHVLNCAGLHADRIAAMTGHLPDVRIVPFRGEYFRLREGRKHLCRGLIYPVPDPRFPFLGVHLTKTIDGAVLCGPNAVPALAREGYDWTTASLRDVREAVRWPGFRRLALGNIGYGASELWRSMSKRAFARSLQRLVPEVTIHDLEPARAGVRAQALHRDGSLADDFVISGTDRVTHVCNAPSPAATSSLAIGAYLSRLVLGDDASLKIEATST